jgi:hypothetical protein
MWTTESYIKLKKREFGFKVWIILMRRRLRIPWIYSLEQIKEEERVVLLVVLDFIVITCDPEHLQDERK